jgi:hypothetical protein
MVQTMTPGGYAAWPSPYPPVAGGAVGEGVPPGVFTVTRRWVVVQNEPDEGWITLTSADRPHARELATWARGGLGADGRGGGLSADAALEGGDA